MAGAFVYTGTGTGAGRSAADAALVLTIALTAAEAMSLEHPIKSSIGFARKWKSRQSRTPKNSGNSSIERRMLKQNLRSVAKMVQMKKAAETGAFKRLWPDA
jgi:hypothetical protein